MDSMVVAGGEEGVSRLGNWGVGVTNRDGRGLRHLTGRSVGCSWLVRLLHLSSANHILIPVIMDPVNHLFSPNPYHDYRMSFPSSPLLP